jgi:hypothetical protein
MPMIARRLDLPLPDAARSAFSRDATHPVAAEVYPLPFASPDGDWRAIYDGSIKFVWNSLGHHELFDLDADPGESVNLVGQRPAVADDLMARLQSFFDSLPPAPEPQSDETTIDPETIDALKGLGYIN